MVGRFCAGAAEDVDGFGGGGGGFCSCTLGRLEPKVSPPTLSELAGFRFADGLDGAGGGGGFLTFFPIIIANFLCCSRTSRSFFDDMTSILMYRLL